MTQLQSLYSSLIEESFQLADPIPETESARLFEESEFINSTTDDLNRLINRISHDEFNKFANKVGPKLERLFGLKTLPEPVTKIPEPKRGSQGYFPEIPPENPFKPNANDFGTFGGQEVPVEEGFGFHDFGTNKNMKKSGGFEDFQPKIEENPGGFDGFKRVESGGFDQGESWGKGSGFENNFGGGSFEPVVEKKPQRNNDIIKSEVIKPSLKQESKFKKSIEVNDFGRGFGHEDPISNVFFMMISLFYHFY